MTLDPKRWFAALSGICRTFPVESGIVAFTLVVGISMVAGVFGRFREGMAMIPLCFAAAYILNRLLRGGWVRWIYRFCWVAMVPLWWCATDQWIGSTAYFVAYPCLLLGVFSCRAIREDDRFAEEALAYLYAGVMAFGFASVAYLLLLAIYYSLGYIFGWGHSFVPDFESYALVICYGAACPMMLLAFISRLRGGGKLGDRMFSTLFNWILTPALLIYTGILYLYFVTIVVSWSLPRGGIAYMVFAFAMTAVAVGACQPLLKRRLYDWFFGRFGLVALPAVIMFWIGVFCRVQEYGWTEARVYLSVCGAVMTFALAVLTFKRNGRYLCICLTALVLLAVFTYLPPISADRLGCLSQRGRVGRIASGIGLLDGRGDFDVKRRPLSDTVYKEEYRRMYESLTYLEQAEQPLFGLQEADDLLKIAPEPIENHVRNRDVVETVEPEESLSLQGEVLSFDIRGYGSLSFPDRWSSDSDRYAFENDTLRIYLGDTLRCVVSAGELMETQLRRIGTSAEARPRRELLEENAEKLLVWRADSLTVIFSSLSIHFGEDRMPTVSGLDVRCVLLR